MTGMKQICYAVLMSVVIVALALLSCAQSESGPETASSVVQHPLQEKIIGTWVSSELGYPMKVVFDGTGQIEYYNAILDPSPSFWGSYELDDVHKDSKEIEWISMTCRCDEALCGEIEDEFYALFTVSPDGTQLVYAMGYDEPIEPQSKADFSQKYFRLGTESADGVEDIPSATMYVVIDRSEPSYLLFFGIPDESMLESVRREIDEKQEVYPWPDFVPRSREIVEGFVVHDDYSYPILVPGIVEVLRNYPQTPIGLTWNGGIAFTRMDYAYAEDYYSRWIADPKKYERTKTPQDFAHHPSGHFGGLLGW